MKSCLAMMIVLLVESTIIQSSLATLINGDFATGDLSGWSTEALDDNNDVVSPPISLVNHASGNVVQLNTVSYVGLASVTPTTSLFQSFAVNESIISFDIGLASATDPDEINEMSFADSLEISIDNGAEFLAILILEGTELIVDPFGDAPGMVVTATASSHPALTHHIEFKIDTSLLAVSNAELEFSVNNELDRQSSTGMVANVAINPVPEPASLMLFAIGSIALIVRKNICSP